MGKVKIVIEYDHDTKSAQISFGGGPAHTWTEVDLTMAKSLECSAGADGQMSYGSIAEHRLIVRGQSICHLRETSEPVADSVEPGGTAPRTQPQ